MFENLELLREEGNPFISTPLMVSDVMEFCFCKRFIYFMYCLGIPQREEQHYKVLVGRELHAIKEKQNVDYLRRKLGVVKKDTSVYLISERLGLSGVVDEVLHLNDGTLAPLDYKYAFYSEFTFKTHKIQSILYALLIQEVYQKEVKRGFIVYTRSSNKVKTIVFTQDDFKNAIKILSEIREIIRKGIFPEKTKFQEKCRDCAYRKICI
jgi:CRISPR-associated exonuclease Cas4